MQEKSKHDQALGYRLIYFAFNFAYFYVKMLGHKTSELWLCSLKLLHYISFSPAYKQCNSKGG